MKRECKYIFILHARRRGFYFISFFFRGGGGGGGSGGGGELHSSSLRLAKQAYKIATYALEDVPCGIHRRCIEPRPSQFFPTPMLWLSDSASA
jgi:hypothetical protein